MVTASYRFLMKEHTAYGQIIWFDRREASALKLSMEPNGLTVESKKKVRKAYSLEI